MTEMIEARYFCQSLEESTGKWKNFLDPFRGHKHLKTAEKQLRLYQKECPHKQYQILEVTTATTIVVTKKVIGAL